MKRPNPQNVNPYDSKAYKRTQSWIEYKGKSLSPYQFRRFRNAINKYWKSQDNG